MYTVKWIGAVFYTRGRERPVRRIVLHWMATNLAGCDATFLGGVRRASAHYGLEEIKRHQYVRESDTAWHAGDRDINHESIGIEHSAQPGRPASEGTIANSIDLCTALCRRYGLTADDIDVHSDFYATQCPGTLPVSRIREGVRANLAQEDDVTPEQLRAELMRPEFLREVARFGATGFAWTGPDGVERVLAGHLSVLDGLARVAIRAASEDLTQQQVKDAVREALDAKYDAEITLTPKEQ